MQLKKINFLITAISFLYFSFAFAGNEFGGGFVFKNRGNFELFDFYEYSIKSIKITPIQDLGHFKAQVDDLGFDKEVSEKVLFKLNEIYAISPEFANHLAQILFHYSWYIVDVEFKQLEDLGPSPIDYTKLVLIPTALRNQKNFTIYISKEFFEKLDVSNKVGLIFHEILGSYLEFCPEMMVYNTAISRKINAYLFNPKTSKRFSDLQKLMSGLNVNRCVPLADVSKKLIREGNNWAEVYFNWRHDVISRPHERIFNFVYQDATSFQKLSTECPILVDEFKNNFYSLEIEVKSLSDKYIEATAPLFEQELAKYPDVIEDYGQYVNLYWSIETELSQFLDSCFGLEEANSGKCSIKPAFSYRLKHRNNSSLDKPSMSLEWIEKDKFSNLQMLKQTFDRNVSKLGSHPYSKCQLEVEPLLQGEELKNRLEFVK